jgi:hypothetical protein
MAPGFKTTSIGPFKLQIDQAVKIDAELRVGNASTTVKVLSDTSPLLQTQDATLGTTISANTIESIPLNGQNFQFVTLMVPGAVDATYASMSGTEGTERNTGSEGVPSFNGNRQQTNNYILDGVEINQTLDNLVGYNPSPASLQEVRVITGNANAEYGNVNGGEVIMVTKGGTNQFHGSLFEYFENDALTANSWANNFAGVPESAYTQNQFGATIGGPIKKNKLFFFGDYEGFHDHTGGLGTASLPTAKMRTGDFSEILTAYGVQLYNTQNGQGFTNATPYPNNKIPINNPVAKFLFADPSVYPLPNKAPTDALEQNDYVGSYKVQVANNQGDIRVDYNLSQKDAVMGRYTIGDAYDTTPQVIVPVIFPANNDYPFQSFVANWVHTFSPTLVNEFRAGFSRVVWIQGAPADPSGVFGMSGDSKVGIPFPHQPYPGFSEMNIGSVESNFGTDAIVEDINSNTFDYGDDFTWQHGLHTTKFGVQAVRYQQNFYYSGNSGAMGMFDYSGQFSSNPNAPNGYGWGFADLVMNESNGASIGGVAGPFGQRQYRDAAYVQDDWRILPNLTINVGLRYAYDQPIYEIHNKEVNVNLSNPALGTAGLEYAGKNGNSRALYNPYYYQFMPRVGFALQVDPRIVFRGAYGITDDLEGTGTNLRLTQNPPFFSQYTDNTTTPDATSGGIPLLVQNGFATAPGNVSVSTTTYNAWAKNLRPALVQEYNLAVQYMINNQTTAQIGYVGEVGQHMIVPEQANQWASPTAVAPFNNLVGQYGAILVTQSEGYENYNALQATLHHQENNGLEYTINYTWSKSLTDNTGFYGTPGVGEAGAFYQNIYDPHGDYGPSGFDTRNTINANMVYILPFGHGKKFGGNWNKTMNVTLGGWELSGDAILYSGFPVTMFTPENYFVNSYGVHAMQYLPLKLKHQTVHNWWGTDPSAVPCSGSFNGTCAYGVELPTGFGNARNGNQRAPGYRQIDLSAFKAFPIKGSQVAQLRVDAFNVFNLASYGAPNSTLTSPDFGQITGTLSQPRQLQISFHYIF